MVDRAMVQKLAAAAHIALEAEEVDRLAAQLADILDQIAPLAGLAEAVHAAESESDTDAVERAATALRADEAGADPMVGGIARFAPEVKEGFFTVPRLPSQGPQ